MTTAPDANTLDDLPPVEVAGVLTADLFDVTVHDAIVTIRNPRTGRHRTFSISTVHTGTLKGKRIVGLMIGPNDFRGFGFADEFGVKVWTKMRYADGGPDPAVWEIYANMLENPRAWAARGAEYLVAGRCRRCSRLLSRPDSIKDGLGADCRAKIGG